MKKDYKELYEERAAIMQFDGGLSQKEAEQKACAEVTNNWIAENDLDMKKSGTYAAINNFKKELQK